MGKADEWTTRLWHESQTHTASSFITLTFNDDHLPETGSVSTRDVQLFIKRLRKHLGHGRVRYLACGEYGEDGGRPHYHAILFGFDFPDRYPWRKSASGHVCYRSPTLERLWPYGHCEVGTVTRQSLGYVARYVLKKVGGEAAEDHYTRMNPVTGEIHRVKPEFITMSTKPGIGLGWYTRYKRDAFPSDFVTVDGEKKPIPRYYTKKLKAEYEGVPIVEIEPHPLIDRIKPVDPSHPEVIAYKRKQRAFKHKSDQTPERLATREEVQQRRVQRLKRSI